MMAQTPSEAGIDMVDGMDYWAKRWNERKTGWQLNNVNPTLIEYLNRLAEPGQSKKFFIPLCGQTYDIAYLLGLGHSVFGVEGVKEVIAQLNERDNLGMEFNQQDSAFKSQDGRLVIYIGDILECPVEKWGPFDVIFDRASLIAMNYVNRPGYIDVIQRSVRKDQSEYADFKILLEVVNYDKLLHAGPPRAVDADDMANLFGAWTTSEVLHQQGPTGVFLKLQSSLPTGSTVDVTIYLLTPKL